MNLLSRNNFLLYFLLMLHFTPFSIVSTLLQSILIFYYIGFKREIDLFQVFLLLIPVIVFRSGMMEENVRVENSNFAWIRFYLPQLQGIVMLGPLAVSTKLFAALGVIPRLILDKTKFGFLHFTWVLVLILCIIGLYLSIVLKVESAGGLTVGLRIVLSIGVILLPLLVDRIKFRFQLLQIIYFSCILFVTGLLNDHWIFVLAGIAPIMLFEKVEFIPRLLSITTIFIILFLGFTFTLKITLIVSLVSLLMIKYNVFQLPKLSKSFFVKYFYISFPLLMIFLAIGGYLDAFFGLLNLERLSFKFFQDRLPIWSTTLNFIKNSNFFIVAAGRDIIVYDYGILGESNWGAGAHNIYLEMARQIGVFSSIVLFIIIFKHLFKLFSHLKVYDPFTKNMLFGLIAVYMIYGLTGNSLIYDGVGFLFWLIIGQAYKLNFKS